MRGKKLFTVVKHRIERRKLEQQRKIKIKRTWSGFFGWLIMVVAGLFVLGVLGVGGTVWVLGSDLPDVKDFKNFITSQSTVIYDREGNILYTIHGDENRSVVSLNEIPQPLIYATIAIEDDQFYTHPGFDVGGIVKAGLHEVFGVGKARGGSTITQQLVKNVFLSPEKSYVRKFKELILAMRLERYYTKDEILEMYLNRIPYGSNAYGVEMAAKTFFDKDAKSLTLLESSILASLPQAPSRLSPYGGNRDLLMGYTNEKGTYVSGRKDVVLARMQQLGYITAKQKEEAETQVADLEFRKYREEIKAPHFVFYVRELLEKKFGQAAVEAGGLRVYTTLDPTVQDVAEQTLQDKHERNLTNYNAGNAAVLSVDATNGEILAMVGSVDYFDEENDGNVNVVTRPRSPGSSFKPIVYAAGFLNGFAPGSVLMDVETDFGNNYKPQNYDGTFNGPVSVRTALSHSLNIPAVKMAYLAGLENVLDVAAKLGITSLSDPDQYGVSIGLGTGEVSMMEMVKAYSVFARGGTRVEFNPFIKIEDSRGNVIEDYSNVKIESEEVLDPQIAYLITNVLSDTSVRPEGWKNLSISGRPNAAKTGTSNKVLSGDVIKPGDVWTIGYTPRVVTAVWAGNNNNTPMASTASGVAVASPMWKVIMEAATQNQPIEEFPVPDGITNVDVAKLSGKLPSDLTPEDEILNEVFAGFNVPTEEDDVFGEIDVDGVTGKLPTEFTPESAIEKAVILNFHSEKPDDPNWEQPVQNWVKEHYTDARYLTVPPEELDNVHTVMTGDIKPSITIVSPKNGGALGYGNIGLIVDVSSQRDIKRVDYFVDDILVDSAKRSPYRGSFELKKDNFDSDHVTITAKIYDSLLYSDSDSVNVRIGVVDVSGPEVTFVYPQGGDLIAMSEVANITVAAFDNEGDVQEVIFYLDDVEIGMSDTTPFTLSHGFSGLSEGNHTLKAVAMDNAGNKNSAEIGIRLGSIGSQVSVVSLIQPDNGAHFKIGDTTTLVGRVPASKVQNVDRVQFIVRKKDRGALASRRVIGEVKGVGDGDVFSLIWSDLTAGVYEVYLVVYYTDGNNNVSNKAIVTVQ